MLRAIGSEDEQFGQRIDLLIRIQERAPETIANGRAAGFSRQQNFAAD